MPSPHCVEERAEETPSDESARLREVLPRRLTQALRSSGLSRKSLARIVGVHLNTVHAYASGQRFPRLAQLTLLARTLDVSLDWLLDLEDVGLDPQLSKTDAEILEYVQVENRRGHHPTFVEISHAFDQEPYWSSPLVRRLQRFGYLSLRGGFSLTTYGLTSLPKESRWAQARVKKKRSPVV